MKKIALILSTCFLSITLQAQTYYPGTWGNWEKKTPEELGLDPDSIQSAVEYAQAMETSNPRNMEVNHYQTFGREPFGDGIGPFKERGDQTGIIIKNGYIIAEWGEPYRVDMTHSVAKTVLSTTVGLAYDKGLIRDVHDKVGPYMAPIHLMEFDANEPKTEEFGESKFIEPFTGEHNSKITWNHLLRQTSDWEGTLFGKPDWADRPTGDRSTWMTRERNEPGTVYEYNDVRVNLLALATLNVFREPLPQIFRENVMNKIGGSPTWRWYGYETSWVVIDGRPIQSVSGGGHWGGGVYISARDQARLGYLLLRNGEWNGEQIISEEWLEMARTPTEANPGYGFMNFFLNGNQEGLPSAPETSVRHLGAGTNMVYVDYENDLVIVARWIRGSAMDGIVRRVLNAHK
ncbi:MAG: class C beta-lactamase-related serine hydrolase [Balneola sp.]|nr:MAG: class C beta-lactamase-related serine hydrolase [Balneola sp.]